MDEGVDFAEGEESAVGVDAEHVVHRIRPIDASPRQIPIPEAATAAIERRIDAAANSLARKVGLSRPRRLQEKGGRHRAEHDDGRE